MPEILNRPKRDMWVEVYTRDGEPGVELLLTPCRSQTEFDELMEDIAQDGATNGTLCYSQNIPYIRFVGQHNIACALMVIQDIAYYYTFFTPSDELIANWVQAYSALSLPLNQIEQYAPGANIPAAGQTMPTALQGATQTPISVEDWKQLYLDYLQTHLTFDENDDFYIQILALQDYDLDGTPEILLGIPYGDTSGTFFSGRLFTAKNDELAQYLTDDGKDTLYFTYPLLNAKLSQDLENGQMSWVYGMPQTESTVAYGMESCGNFILDREALLIGNPTAYSLVSSSAEEEIRSVTEVSNIDEWYTLRDGFLAKFNMVSDQSCNHYQIRSEHTSIYFSDSEALLTDIVINTFDAWYPLQNTQGRVNNQSEQQASVSPMRPDGLKIKSIQSKQTYTKASGYDAGNLTDGNNSTCWIFDRIGYTDITQVSLTIQLNDMENTVTGIRIANGYWKSEDRYYHYSRVSGLRLSFYSAGGTQIG